MLHQKDGWKHILHLVGGLPRRASQSMSQRLRLHCHGHSQTKILLSKRFARFTKSGVGSVLSCYTDAICLFVLGDLPTECISEIPGNWQ